MADESQMMTCLSTVCVNATDFVNFIISISSAIAISPRTTSYVIEACTQLPLHETLTVNILFINLLKIRAL